MDKIFDKETQEYLIKLGISQKEIMKIQHEKYKEGMLKILNSFVKAVEKEDQSTILDYMDYSPAGDGYGLDNNIISFSSIRNDENLIDIGDAFDILKSYKAK